MAWAIIVVGTAVLLAAASYATGRRGCREREGPGNQHPALSGGEMAVVA